jgi:hypothetical protein
MVNHFASLLSNLNLYAMAQTAVSYLLLSSDNYDIVTDDSYLIDLAGEYERSSELVKLVSPLVNNNYNQISLPLDLQKFHNILFPESASSYYKQFLLYCYLRIIESTDRHEDIKKYDHRVSYNLDLIFDYFKFNRVYLSSDNPKEYKLLVFGKMLNSASANYYSNSFIISQIPNTTGVQVYSYTQNQYYKPFSLPVASANNSTITLSASNPGITDAVAIGDTGLFFSIVGNFQNFISPYTRSWEFTAEAPFRFDFLAKMQEFKTYQHIVTKMLDYRRAECDMTYENIWNLHHSDVYKLAGLLLAYVERVNLIYAG